MTRIAEAACPHGSDAGNEVPLVIEIGAGEGALTEHLADRARRVVAIELDPELVGRLMVRFAGASARPPW